MRIPPASRVLSAALVSLSFVYAQAPATQTATGKIVGAVNAFLSTLDATERQKVLFAFNDEEQRARWSNFPISIVPRAGLSMGELSAPQRAAAMTVMSTVLSKRGFEKIEQIMDADENLKSTDGGGGGPQGRGGPKGDDKGGFKGPGGPGGPGGGKGPGGFKGDGGGKGKGGGGGLMFGKDLYYISILGTPSEKAQWMLQFGGHHLALNITIDGQRGILTPSLTGAQPSLYTLNGKTIRPLGQESDKAVMLLNSLDDAQRKQAVLSSRMADLVLGPGEDGKTIQPEGLKASSMNDKQKAMLLDVVSEWAGIIHESAAAARMAELKAEVNSMWFAWSGPTNVTVGTNISSYYRIQGPHVVIEYAPQQMGGDPSMHIHAMYRDPTDDYGRKPAAK